MLRRFAIMRTLATVGVALLMFTVAATSAHAKGARAVTLGDARYAPSMLVYVYGGGDFTPWQCPAHAYFSETQAYTWKGGTLGPQRWNADHTLTYWQASSGRRVTFDGLTFHNGLRGRVLVAGWCG